MVKLSYDIWFHTSYFISWLWGSNIITVLIFAMRKQNLRKPHLSFRLMLPYVGLACSSTVSIKSQPTRKWHKINVQYYWSPVVYCNSVKGLHHWSSSWDYLKPAKQWLPTFVWSHVKHKKIEYWNLSMFLSVIFENRWIGFVPCNF